MRVGDYVGDTHGASLNYLKACFDKLKVHGKGTVYENSTEKLALDMLRRGVHSIESMISFPFSGSSLVRHAFMGGARTHTDNKCLYVAAIDEYNDRALLVASYDDMRIILIEVLLEEEHG